MVALVIRLPSFGTGCDSFSVVADRHRYAHLVTCFCRGVGQLGILRGVRPSATRLNPYVHRTGVADAARVFQISAGRDRAAVLADRHRTAQLVIFGCVGGG